MATFDLQVLNLADTDTLEQFYDSQTNTQTEFMQLSRGSANLHATSLDLGEVKILQVEGDGHHLWTDRMQGRTWRLGFVRGAGSSVRVGGTNLTPSIAGLLRPGEESAILTTGSYQTLEITISEKLITELGWNIGGGQLRQVNETSAKNLATVCSLAAELFSSPGKPEVSKRNNHRERHWREIILDWVDVALEPWKDQADSANGIGSQRRSQEIVARVMKHLREHEYAKSANVEELAGKMGISARSIYLAFQKEIGLGPKRFRKLLHLNELRSALYSSNADEKTVTEIAHEHGFSELGRTAVVYRNLFGESPSETLRRH